MDPLYIVDVDVVGKDGEVPLAPKTVFNRLLDHVVEWFNRDAIDALNRASFVGAGAIDHPIQRHGKNVDRHIRWARTGTADVESFQCTVTQELDGAPGANFICEVTLFRSSESAALRIEMGRETIGGLVRPASLGFFRRPGLLRNVLRDASLTCRSQGQVVDGRYQWINPPQAAFIPKVLAHTQRLPLLLVDGRDDEAQGFGRAAASELAGLAQVVLIDGPSMRLIESALEELDVSVPENGARLVWPALGLRSPDFTDWQIARRNRAISTLLRMVATASVAARGQNHYSRRALESARQFRESVFQHDLAEARAAGDAASEVNTLAARVEELQQESDFWASEAERLEGEVDELRAAKSEAQYWKVQALAAQQSMAGPSGTSWQDAPDLEVNKLDGLAVFLTTVSRDAIVFTANASRSWKQSDYPYVERMGDALVTLAQAAVEWRRSGCKTDGMVIDDWFKIRWDVNMAGTDKGLRKTKGNKFQFDGMDLIREPHLKLDDHVKPNEVGRIYFALDSENQRFVVDHVGTKLY